MMTLTIQSYITEVIFYFPIIFLGQFILWFWIKPQKSYPRFKLVILLAVVMFIVVINNVVDRIWGIRVLANNEKWNTINYWVFFISILLMLVSFLIVYSQIRKQTTLKTENDEFENIENLSEDFILSANPIEIQKYLSSSDAIKKCKGCGYRNAPNFTYCYECGAYL